MPTENRSSNTEMVSVPREHELKIRQTPLADLLSGLKTGEIRDCSDREFAVGDTVLLREIDDARDYTGTVLRRTITHVQKHYGLPEHLCVLSYGQPAPQPHPEPIAWMVGTAFWWTKEKAERDAVAMGLPVVGLGPMTGIAPAEQHQVEPVAYQIRSKTDRPDSQWTPWRECCETTRAMHSHEVGRFNQYGIMREIRPVFTHSDSGEVERLRADLTEMTTFRDNAANHMKRIRAEATAFEKERDALRAKLAERDSRLRELLADDIPLRVAAKIEAALSASAEQEVKS